MATTSYVEFTAAARAIGARTDSAGAAVGDVSAEEDRLIQSIVTEGYLTTDAFIVEADGADMDVTVGSGSAKADLYAVAGEVAGQGVYLARLDQTPVTVTIAAAEASQIRNDEVYLVIADNAYDASARSLPRIGYRKGDAGGALPGPDAAWKASALLATVNVTAATTTIEQADITDERTEAGLTLVPPATPAVRIFGWHRDAGGDIYTGGTFYNLTGSVTVTHDGSADLFMEFSAQVDMSTGSGEWNVALVRDGSNVVTHQFDITNAGAFQIATHFRVPAATASGTHTWTVQVYNSAGSATTSIKYHNRLFMTEAEITL